MHNMRQRVAVVCAGVLYYSGVIAFARRWRSHTPNTYGEGLVFK